MFNFFGDGGFPGGGHSHGGRPGREEPVDTEKFYKILQIDKSATANDVKKAYRKLAMTHHPDKGGDEAKFKEISQAYEVLSDEEKRKNYDQYGEKGLEAGGGGGMDPSDIFSNFFGGGGGGRRSQGPRKGKDVRFRLGVQLADLYNGGNKKLRLTKSVICTGCKGVGGSNAKKCAGCKGQGVKMMYRQLGPGMVQQMQAHCEDCAGEGEVITNKCKECKGEKIKKEKKTLEVHINKGMRNGEKVVFRGESDEAPGLTPGDVVVELECTKHEKFVRQGDHLFYKKKITLLESLVGFEFTLEHLDGRIIKVSSAPGTVYPHECFKSVADEGFPTHRNPFVRGNLYIEFQVEWPATLDPKLKAQLVKLLPGPAKGANSCEVKEGAEIEDVLLADVDMEVERQRMKEQARQDGEEEGGEEGEGGPQQASCRTQ